MMMNGLAGREKKTAKDISREQFVQDILSLVYSDNAFVDKLYHEYIHS